MTKNQIEYQKLVETKRANQVQEAQTKWRDSANYSVAIGQLREAQRHNYATEAAERVKLGETIRHNQVGEQISLFNAQELARHNVQTEQISRDNITLGYHQLDESRRHNIAVEDESRRHNLRVEFETQRSNRAIESLTRYNYDSLDRYRTHQIELGYSQLAETKRSNQANEALKSSQFSWQVHRESSQLMENHRSNLANEQLTRERNAETARSNKASEYLKDYQLQIAKQQADEAQRHNREQESVARKLSNVDVARAITSGIKDLASSSRDVTQGANNYLSAYDRYNRIIIEGGTPLSPFTTFHQGGHYGGGASRGNLQEKK